jgi:hypothetical protein
LVIQVRKPTTDYTRACQELIGRTKPASCATLMIFEFGVPVAEVQSASVFDRDVYRRFNRSRTATTHLVLESGSHERHCP